jgi:hypothetical protein
LDIFMTASGEGEAEPEALVAAVFADLRQGLTALALVHWEKSDTGRRAL